MSKPKVILFGGKAGNGKDYAAKTAKEYLEKFQYSVRILHFADLLKYICKEYCDWDGKKDEKGRKLLQEIGTEVFRFMDKNYWVYFVKTILTAFSEKWDYVLIPDFRFPNEASELSYGGFDVYSIQIKTDKECPYKNGHSLTSEEILHSSENSLDYYIFNYRITNRYNDFFKNEIENVIDDIIRIATYKEENKMKIIIFDYGDGQAQVFSSILDKKGIDYSVQKKNKIFHTFTKRPVIEIDGYKYDYIKASSVLENLEAYI